MLPTFIPPSPADTPTLYPSDPEPPGWHSWHPADPWTEGTATLLLPPAIHSRSLPPIPYGTLGPPTELLPPPMLGPVRVEEPWIAPPPPTDLFVPAPATAPAPVSAPVPAPLPLDLYPIERCARIEASIARNPDQAAEILTDHGLDALTWRALRNHWQDAIQAEIDHGKSTLLRAHDAAFLAQLEQQRGPLTAEDLARLTLAAERGTRSKTLATLGLPPASGLAIDRALLARASKDPKLRASMRAAIEAARHATAHVE